MKNLFFVTYNSATYFQKLKGGGVNFGRSPYWLVAESSQFQRIPYPFEASLWFRACFVNKKELILYKILISLRGRGGEVLRRRRRWHLPKVRTFKKFGQIFFGQRQTDIVVHREVTLPKIFRACWICVTFCLTFCRFSTDSGHVR